MGAVISAELERKSSFCLVLCRGAEAAATVVAERKCSIRAAVAAVLAVVERHDRVGAEQTLSIT